jgi:trans-aconitate methyltransferase
MFPKPLSWLIHGLQEKRRLVRQARKKIGNLLGIAPVVEIGCGFGPNSRYCRGSYIGVDINPGAIPEAKRLYPSVDFRCGDVGTILFDQKQVQ